MLRPRPRHPAHGEHLRFIIFSVSVKQSWLQQYNAFELSSFADLIFPRLTTKNSYPQHFVADISRHHHHHHYYHYGAGPASTFSAIRKRSLNSATKRPRGRKPIITPPPLPLFPRRGWRSHIYKEEHSLPGKQYGVCWTPCGLPRDPPLIGKRAVSTRVHSTHCVASAGWRDGREFGSSPHFLPPGWHQW